jgi:hypothetical protein
MSRCTSCGTNLSPSHSTAIHVHIHPRHERIFLCDFCWARLESLVSSSPSPSDHRLLNLSPGLRPAQTQNSPRG